MKYLKEYNEYNNKYYHGSPFKLDALKVIPETSGETKFLGKGIYITNNKDIANTYGKYTYEVTLSEPLNSLSWNEEIDINKFKEIGEKFQESDNSDISYLGDTIEEAIDDNEIWWGKTLVSELERYDLNANEILISFGYNAIEAPMNMMNQFRDRPYSDRNINIIKDNILSIKLV